MLRHNRNRPALKPHNQINHQTNKTPQVINAGVFHTEWTEEALRRSLAVNFTGAVDCALKLAPHMAPGGLVIAVSSGG